MVNNKHTTLMEAYRKACKQEAKRILGIKEAKSNE
jgi:hypothetical protein